MISRRVSAAILVALFLALQACVGRHAGEYQTETRSIDIGNAESAQVSVGMGAGELKISSGAHQLMEGTFGFNFPEWRPDIRYTVTGARGELVVRQPSSNQPLGVSGGENHWDLKLNDHVPMDLNVDLGAGKNSLDLRGLYLRKLSVQMGVGELELDLRGKWKKDVDVVIRGGIGAAHIRLPKNIGVTVRASGGIGGINANGLEKKDGRYVNEAFGDSPVMMKVDVSGGIGEIRLSCESERQ